MKKRIIAAVMAAVMCFSVTSCTDSSDKKQWQITEEEREQLVELSCKAVQNGETLEITLACDEDLFKDDIAKSSIAVNVYEYQPKEKTEGSETSSDVSPETSTSGEEQPNEPQSSFSEAKEITDYTLTRVDAKTLSITFKNPFEYGAYDFYIHKNGTSSGKFAVGSYYKIPENDSSAQKLVSAEIDGTIYNGAENPVLKVTLENATVKDVKPEDIELSGAFEDLSISSVTSNGSEITINTVGDVRICSAPYGYATVSESVLDTGYELMATVDIENPAAYILENSYAYDNGTLKFDVELSGAKAVKSGDELADAITINDMHIDSAAANSDGSVISVSFPTNAADLDSAILSVVDKQLVIKNSALSCQTDVLLEIPDCGAYLNAYLDYIEKTDGGFKGTLVLVPIYGSFSNLTAADLTFDGDLANAKITEIKNEESSTTVTFTFNSDKSLDNSIFEGGVKVARGKLLNAWGTPSDDTSDTFGYMAESVRGDKSKVKEIIAELSKAKKEFDNIKKIAEIIISAGKSAYNLDIKSFVGSSKKLMETLGFIKSAPDKMDKIYSAIESVRVEVENLDKKMDTIMASLKEQMDYMASGIDKDLYINATKGWTDFCTSYIDPLEAVFNSVSNDMRSNVIDLVQYVKAGDTLTVVYDINGGLTIANKLKDTYSVENIAIDKEKTLTLTLDENSFPNASADFSKYAKVEAGLEEDIKNLIIEQGLAADDEAVEKLTKEFMASVTSKAMYDALTKDPQTLNNIQNYYTKFCANLRGDTMSSPLSYRFYSVYAYYNFQYEAEEYLTEFNDYLKAFTIKYGSFAMLAASYNRGYDKESNPIAKDIESTLKFLENNTGLHELPDDTYEWCYVIDRPIKMHIVKIGLPFSQANIKVERPWFTPYGGLGNYVTFLNWNASYSIKEEKKMLETDITNPSHRKISYTPIHSWLQLSDFSDNINKSRLSAASLDRIKKRYLRMGYSADNFFDYMTSEHLFKTGIDNRTDYGLIPYRYANERSLFNEKYLVLTSFDGWNSFSESNPQTLYTTMNYGYKEHGIEDYKLEKSYLVPSGKVRKAKYFSYCENIMGTVYNLNPGRYEPTSESKALISRALYGEDILTQDHWMEFRNTIFDNKDLGAGCYDIYSPEFIEYEVY
ncbi:MAG: hypothetical protein J6C38_01615 [Oscillospiraceae bacterium]|nr:hypothetical protein [Oscillospiraceae bacterium]